MVNIFKKILFLMLGINVASMQPMWQKTLDTIKKHPYITATTCLASLTYGTYLLYNISKQKMLDKKLLTAINKGFLDQAKQCIQEGANVEAKDNNGYTAIHNALWVGHSEIFQLLIDYGANINVKDDYDCTLLHYAALMNHLEICQLLINCDFDINLKDKEGRTPLHIATFGDCPERIGRLLIERGAIVDAKDNKMRTPLYYAVKQNRIKMSQLLAKAGADIVSGFTIQK